MILDERLEFADAVSVAAAAGTDLIGDVIDLGGDGLDGNSEDLYLVIQVSTEVITGGAAGTLTFQLASDAQAAIATDGSATIHAQSDALVTDGTDANDALLKAGQYPLVVQLPRGTYERYLGILAVTATTTTTAGAINAFLTKTPPAWTAMADGVPSEA